MQTFSKKLVAVGDGGCGKTCLLISYSQGYFPERYVPTVFENYITTVQYDGGKKEVEVALWDTAGQEEYDRLRPLSYPETDVLLICFAVDMVSSLESVREKWYPEVRHFCPSTPILLVGCKTDLRENPRAIDILRAQGVQPVTFEQGKKMAERIKAKYAECSSKTMNGVHHTISKALELAMGDVLSSMKKRGCAIL